MKTRNYRPLRQAVKDKQTPRADHATLWVLIVVIVAAAIALTFDDAQGAASVITAAGLGF